MLSSVVGKFVDSLQHDSLKVTLLKLLRYPFKPVLKLVARRKWQSVLQEKSIEQRFLRIYEENLWGNVESVSGTGSTLRYTANLRRHLPTLFKQFSIESVFDAPCGDFNWMREVLKSSSIRYVGGDIVRPLIDQHNKQFRTERTRFVHFDITQQMPPAVDLMICRDCLFHLSYEDARKFFELFAQSQVRFLLTTTHINRGTFENRNITTGDFRRIDLMSSPFSLPDTPLMRIEDWMEPEPEREMCLWSREQIAAALRATAPSKELTTTP